MQPNTYTALPMLASECPGWICFAEKTYPQAIPHISTTKSPQQIAGTLIKREAAAILGVGAQRVYHCTVMPCFDKKLEASRKDFLRHVEASPDVNCVLSTVEVSCSRTYPLPTPHCTAFTFVCVCTCVHHQLLDLMRELHFNVEAEADEDGDVLMGSDMGDEGVESTTRGACSATVVAAATRLEHLFRAPVGIDGSIARNVQFNAGSNGCVLALALPFSFCHWVECTPPQPAFSLRVFCRYVEFLFRYAAKRLFNKDVPDSLSYKQRRNADFREVELAVRHVVSSSVGQRVEACPGCYSVLSGGR